MRNEGSPPALPEVIESLPKVKVTKDQVGKWKLVLLSSPASKCFPVFLTARLLS